MSSEREPITVEFKGSKGSDSWAHILSEALRDPFSALFCTAILACNYFTTQLDPGVPVNPPKSQIR